MTAQQLPSVEALIAEYAADKDADRPGKYWRTHSYTAPTPLGPISFNPDDGARWRLYIELPQFEVESSGTEYLPAPEKIAEEIAALMQRATPDAGAAVRAGLVELQALVAKREEVNARIQALAVDTVRAGGEKINVARAAKVSRPTLDKWLG